MRHRTPVEPSPTMHMASQRLTTSSRSNRSHPSKPHGMLFKNDDLSRGEGFNISQINQRLLSVVAEEVWDTIRMDAIKKVSVSQKISLICTKESFSLLPISFPRLHLNKYLPTRYAMPYYHIHEIPTTTFDIMPCHLYTKKLPCHAIHTADHAMPSTMPTMPCHP